MIFGLDPAFGQGVARKFAQSGYTVALLGGKQNTKVLEWTKNKIQEESGAQLVVDTNVNDNESVKAAFEKVRSSVGIPSFVLYNSTGFLPRQSFSEIQQSDLDLICELDIKGAFIVAKHALSMMEQNKSGTIVFGNTPASLYGRSTSSIGKFALRGLSQTLAREYGPKGVHVIHAIVDEGIKPAYSDESMLTQVTQNFQHHYPETAFLDPSEVADAILFLHNQNSNCWTNEIEFRPQQGAW